MQVHAKQTAELIEKYGKAAAVALSARRVSAVDVAAVLEKEPRLSDKFYELVLEAERKVLRNDSDKQYLPYFEVFLLRGQYINLLSLKPLSFAICLACSQGNKSLEISRKNLRNEVLERIKYVKTCVMARELCLLVRTNRAVLEPKDVQEVCQYISKLCKEEGCTEPSEMCIKAANAVGKADEEKYLELCAQSCVKCGEAKRPQPKKDAYVA